MLAGGRRERLGGRSDTVAAFSPCGLKLIDNESVSTEQAEPVLLRGIQPMDAVALAEALPVAKVRQAARFAFDEKLPEAANVVRCDLLDEEVSVPLVPEWCELTQLSSAAA
jgi:hypothetical protein